MSDENWNKEPREAEKTKKKTVKMLDVSQLEEENLDENKVNEFVDDTSKDFALKGSGVDTPQGSPTEIDKSTRSKRFAKEHENVATKESTLQDVYEGTEDSPADETPNTD
jgi:hypothetical protein